MIRVFSLVRSEDESGVSGTGVVAEGVELSSGQCVLSWLTTPRGWDRVPAGVAVYESLEHLEAVHGHGGKSQVVLHDYPAGNHDALVEAQQKEIEALRARVADLEAEIGSYEQIHADARASLTNVRESIERHSIYPLYENRKPICWGCGAPLYRKGKEKFVCPMCKSEFLAPPELLMREAGAPRLL